MQNKYLLIPLFLAGSFSTYAQVSAVQNLNKNYQTGLELLDKVKKNIQLPRNSLNLLNNNVLNPLLNQKAMPNYLY